MSLTDPRVLLATLHFLPPSLSDHYLTLVFVKLLKLVLPSWTALCFFVLCKQAHRSYDSVHIEQITVRLRFELSRSQTLNVPLALQLSHCYL